MRGGQRAPGLLAGRSAGMRGAGRRRELGSRLRGGRQYLLEDYMGRLPTCPHPRAGGIRLYQWLRVPPRLPGPFCLRTRSLPGVTSF